MIRDQGGFTLVEILVAVTILGILVASFSTLFTSSVNAIYSSGNRYDALTKAQSLLEQALRGQPLDVADGIFRTPITQNVGGLDVKGTLITAKVAWKTALEKTSVVDLSAFQADFSTN